MRHRFAHFGEGRGCGRDRGEHARSPFGRGGGFGDFGPGGPFGEHGPRSHMRMRRRRRFDQAELQALLLALIVEQPRHGYDLIKEIEALSDGEYAPSPGVVYPALTYMEEQGLIVAVADESSRKAYEATEEGRAQLAEQTEAVEALRQRLARLAEAREKADPAPVRRAMQSLKAAVIDRVSREGTDRERVLAIAEIIDEAARKVERYEP